MKPQAYAFFRWVVGIGCLASILATGCQSPSTSRAREVRTAWNTTPTTVEPRSKPAPAASADQPEASAAPATPESTAIAIVDGVPVARQQFIDLLLRGRGPALLDQWAVLEAARAEAGRRSLLVDQADVDAELDRALRRLVDPFARWSEGPLDRTDALRVLGEVLRERGMAMEEFRLGMERNAFLRKLAEADLVIGEPELRAAFEQATSRHVRVRHIQLPTLRQVTLANQRLAAGESFAAVARHLSANTTTAPSGGLLPPFAQGDEDVPLPLQQAAFALEPGTVSDAIALGPWYHLIEVVEFLPGDQRSFAALRPNIEARLRSRLAEPKMQEIYQRLLERARIRVLDPVLREAREVARQGGA